MANLSTRPLVLRRPAHLCCRPRKRETQAGVHGFPLARSDRAFAARVSLALGPTLPPVLPTRGRQARRLSDSRAALFRKRGVARRRGSALNRIAIPIHLSNSTCFFVPAARFCARVLKLSLRYPD